MSAFLTRLDMQLKVDRDGKPVLNGSGRQIYILLSVFSYASDVARKFIKVIDVPKGFETDLASVPRWPIVFLMDGETSQEPAVIHDYLYATGLLPRKLCDEVLLESMTLTGVPWWRKYSIYWGVRLGGASHYGTIQHS